MMTNDESKEAPSNELRCDYLVVGAGAAGMAFVDTLLTEDPTCRVVLVDRRAKAGGHWVDSYPFVRLHQPSHYYGVNSLPLGKARDAKGRECFDRDDLASGAEVVAYYEKVLAQFEASGRVDIRLETSYEARGARALLTTNDGTTSWVTPRKTVTTISNVQVPSTRPPPFPVADGVECRPLNALEVPAHSSYVVCGAGKSGVDAVCHLLDQGVSTDAITWIVPHDRWMHCLFLRDGIWPERTGGYFEAMSRFFPALNEASDSMSVAVNLEKAGICARIFPSGEPPRVFKGATINKSQLSQIRSVAAVRLGRIVTVEPGEIILQQGRLPIAPGTLVVDATAGYDNAPDELFGYNVVDDAFKIFSADSIKLGPSLNLFNVCLSAALTAYLEATCVDDAFKNSLCYFVTGDHLRFSHKTLPALLYYSTKNMDALEKCHPAATMFVLKSRLFDAAPMHHGGLLKFLWAMLGPTLALKAKGKKFLKKVDAGGLSDVPDSFGLGRPLPAKKRGAVRKVKGPKNYPPKRAPRWAPCGCGAPVAAPAK